MATPQEALTLLTQNIETVIQDKTHVIRICLAALLAEGHVLLEDVPGTGKTILARALAASVQGDFRRIQFTPDLLPGDITGMTILQNNEFSFRPGPIMTNILLADEINRATPRTQSALLEAMAEKQVTCDGVTHSINSPFFVIATQNPLESYGTYPLPEAQLDRFIIKINIGYPSLEKEISILKAQKLSHPINHVRAILSPEDTKLLQEATKRIELHDDVFKYLVTVVSLTRSHRHLRCGASPRASLALMRIAQAFALMEGMPHVTPHHIKKMAHPVLNHRVALTHEAAMQNITTESVIKDIVDSIPVPVMRYSVAPSDGFKQSQ